MRLVTVAVVLGLCAFAGSRGFEIIQFARARSAAEHASADAVRRWVGVPGLSYAARADRIGVGSQIGGAADRLNTVARMLAVRPLSATDWLALAEMGSAAAAPRSEMRSALRMSSITGPNEGAVMWQRGIFGLLQWESLSGDARQNAIADLAASIASGVIGDTEINGARIAAALKPAAIRSQIRSMLIGDAVPPPTVTRMGL